MSQQEQSVWTSLPVPTLLVDASNCICDINPAGEGFLNASARSVAGRALWEVVHIEEPIRASFERARKDNAPLFVSDADVGAEKRAPLQSSLQVAPLQGSAGTMILMITPRELTGRFSGNHNVKSAAKSAIGMAEMLAHEIKNPLAGITGAAQLLSMNLSKADLELTDLIVAESRRIVKLLEQVEQFGNLTTPDFKEINLHDVLDRARRSAVLGFGANMRFEEAYDPSLPNAWGDPDQLLQVVSNLMRNATEAAGEGGGTIRIRTYFEHSFRMRRSDGSGHSLPLQIEIIDDGPGLPEKIKADIFDPFVSGRENGTGLGLALVSKIISEHGGLISVESKPGRTAFRLSLPRYHKPKLGQALRKAAQSFGLTSKGIPDDAPTDDTAAQPAAPSPKPQETS